MKHWWPRDAPKSPAPRTARAAGTNEQDGALIHGFDGTSFSLRPDAEGDVWKPDWPVFMVTWYGAQAYAAWEAGRTGQSWRLPGELAREKAARGVDGRYFPWGDGFDPSWACMERSHPGAQLPAPVGAFPIDESVYGIRELAGNVCEWSRDVFLADGPPEASACHGGAHSSTQGHGSRVGAKPADGNRDRGEALYMAFRGGSWTSVAASLRTTYRGKAAASVRGNYLGLRLARDFRRQDE